MRAGGSAVRRGASIALWTLALVALVFAWRYVAPPQLGGQTRYVSTVGGSMEPELHDGDLVLVRPTDHYEVGDVVAYRSQSLNAVVLHRIVAVQGERFVTQGDANSWVDSEQPSADQLLGTMAVRVPGMGDRIGWVRTPSGIAVIAGISTLILELGAFGRRRRRTRGIEPTPELRGTAAGAMGNGNGNGHATGNGLPNGNGASPPNGSRAAYGHGPTAAPSGGVLPKGLSIAAGALLVTLVASSALAAAAFARPTVTTVERDITYQQEGTFSYSAEVEGGKAVYGPDGLTTGDPVYLRLADRLEVTFDYALDSPAVATATGSVALTARISDADGWERAFELSTSTAFDGGRAHVTGSLDLARLQALVRDLQRTTGVERDAYAVSIQARVEGEGLVSGRTVALSFDPALPFTLTGLELQLSPGDADPAELIAPVSGDLVTVRRPVPNDLSLMGSEVSPRTLRVVTSVVALGSAIGLVVLLLVGRRLRRRDEAEQIAARYGRLLVSVDPVADGVVTRTIEVASMDALASMAGHYEQVILHSERDGRHTYFFQDGGTTYRYRAAAGRSASASPSP